MKLAFYNVENLFDTLDDPYINDNAFLPESGLKWNQKRYVLKLQRIARVIKAIEEPMPLVIGLAEVENRKVLKDLVTAMGLTEKEVGIVHENSPDERGIDVGFLYRKDLISRTEHSSHTITFQDDLSDRTRDILHVKAFLNNPLALYLKKQQSTFKGVYGEIFIKNMHGAIIATTGKLSTLINILCGFI